MDTKIQKLTGSRIFFLVLFGLFTVLSVFMLVDTFRMDIPKNDSIDWSFYFIGIRVGAVIALIVSIMMVYLILTVKSKKFDS